MVPFSSHLPRALRAGCRSPASGRSLASRLTLAALGLALATPSTADVLNCTSVPPGAPAFTVELIAPTIAGTIIGCHAEIRGSVELDAARGKDVYIIVDSSGSTAGASGVDVDGDGLLGAGDWRNPTDPGDSTLAAELESVRRALSAWEGRDVRVALLEYSAVIPIPPGEPAEQGRIRTVRSLTANFDSLRAGLGVIAAAGSVGATDYGGALFELAREFDRSSDPMRDPVAFFLSDGKPTFPRYPFDSTETLDVEHAMLGAAGLQARGLPVSTLEIGTFDDIGVLRDIATLTGGTLLPGLVGTELLDAIATMDLDGFAWVRARNQTSGEESWASFNSFGTFTTGLDLVDGANQLEFTTVLRTANGEWTITCPVTVMAACPQLAPPDGGGGSGGGGGGGGAGLPPGRGGGGADGGGGDGGAGGGGNNGGGGATDVSRPGGGGRRLYPPPIRPRRPWTADRLSRWGIEPCVGLEGTAQGFNTDCQLAAQQLTALLISLEVGELHGDCRLDPALVPTHADVDALIAALEDALNRNSRSRCANAAAAAALVTAGGAFAPQPMGNPPSGTATFDCVVVQDGTEVDVTVALTSPAPGTTATEPDCGAALRLTGGSSAAGTVDHDVYFVVDTSGSTIGDSGRDLDGDGTNESTLEAELEAVRTFVQRLDPARVRVALIEFSAVIPIPPGLPSEQGRIRTVRSLTSDFASFYAALGTVLAAGPVGATDYGGALLELAAEYDRNGDPARGQVAFFLSDGKPTFPRYPYDSTESNDINHALDGAAGCASRSLVVNTYEVGVFDDLSVLQSVAQVTGGRFFASLAGGAIIDTLPGSSLVGIQSVQVRNDLTGVTVTATLAPDGSFQADIELAPGENPITLIVTSDNGVEVVECTTTFVGDCAWPACAARPPSAWFDEDCR